MHELTGVANMSYWANPFDTTAGMSVQKTLFESLYMDEGKTGFDFREHAYHFESRFFQGRGADMVGVAALRTLTLVYDDLDRGMSRDSGIYCCEVCGRKDHLWSWEYIDFGFYNDDQWLSGVYEPNKAPGGIYNGSAYGITAQVRCNEVSSCTHCGITYLAPISDITTCQQCDRGPAESDPDKLGMVQAGCGAMGTVYHDIPPITAAQSYTISAQISSQTSRVNFVTLVSSKSLTVRIPKQVNPSSMVIEWTGDTAPFSSRQGECALDRRQAKQWIPELSIILPARVTTSGRGTANSPIRFPISLFGGYSSTASPLYPGLTAFGGNSITQIKHDRSISFAFAGYRTPTPLSTGSISSWKDATLIPGYTNTLRTQSRVKLVSTLGPTDRTNRSFQLTQFVLHDGDASTFNANGVKVEQYPSGGGRSWRSTRNTDAYTESYTDRLPVMRFRSEQPDFRGQLVDGRCGFCMGGHSSIACPSKGGVVDWVNLLNPSMRDIDDHGLLRVAAQRIIPIPEVPSVLKAEDPGIPGIGLTCPNDTAAAYAYMSYAIDVKDGLLSKVREILKKWRESQLLAPASGTVSNYPWGVSPIGDIEDPAIKELLDDFGIVTPNTPPLSFFSYIITLQKARAVVETNGRMRPAFSQRRRRPIAYSGVLDADTMATVEDDGDYNVDYWFYARHGGSGSRRSGNLVKPTKYRRFGTVAVEKELVEDAKHQSSMFIVPPLVTKLHSVRTFRNFSFDDVNDTIFKTHYCETCRDTYSGSAAGSIMNQMLPAVANLVMDPGGWPVSWDFVENNRLGLADWQIACQIAFEDNRKLQICPDAMIEVIKPADPMTEDPTINYEPYWLVPGSGIKDIRYPEEMMWVPEGKLPTVPGYTGHDDKNVTIDGQVFEIPTPRKNYLMSEHGDHSNYSPLPNLGVGLIRNLAPNGPFYRRDPVGNLIPIMWGVMKDGRKVTTGNSSLAATGVGGVP